MGDVRCLNCGEPWEAYYMRHENTKEGFEKEGFEFYGDSTLIITRCPACPRTRSILRDRLAKREAKRAQDALEMLGGDEDALQTMLEDGLADE